MNMQAMLKQAQKIQSDMLKEKSQIDEKEFVGSSSLVKIVMNGKKEVKKVELTIDQIEADDKEMLEDMIMVAVNDAISKIDKETEQKLGKYTQGMPGLF